MRPDPRRPTRSPIIKFGFVLSYGTPGQLLEMAKAAEDAGWDGVFSWDGISVGSMDSYDPWTILAAIATATERITLGALVFALARRKPWEVARQSITVDHLSNGRLVIPVGLGAAHDDAGFARVNTDTSDRRVNAAKLDECLAFLELAWSGEEFSAAGEHYRADRIIFRPTPVQHPRIPVWCVALWPVPKSIDRAARWDGIIPAVRGRELTPDDVRDIRAWAPKGRFEIVVEGTTEGPADWRRSRAFAEAGATWFIESRWEAGQTPDVLLERIRQGPPRR